MFNFEKANEVLYVLYSVHAESEGQKVSKIAMQKILYLSNILLPLKNMAMAICEFITYHRGPFSKELQNTLDQLSMFGFISIVDFQKHETSKQVSYANYMITDSGRRIVDEIIKYKHDREKFDWISIVTKISLLYTVKLRYFDNLDGIVKLVYQDPAFLEAKKQAERYELINSDKYPQTKELIDICIQYYKESANGENNEKNLFEFVVLTMFEFYYLKYIGAIDGNEP